MSRHDDQRIADVLAAMDAIDAHLERGTLHDGLMEGFRKASGSS